MRLQKKSYSRLSLSDLLRRRRTDLKKFLDDTGIVTYELLTKRCESMGVVPPTENDFKAARGNLVMHNVSSPTEGIVVLDPPRPKTEAVNPQEVLVEESISSAGLPAAEKMSDPVKGSKKKRKKDVTV